ncbi:PREDICTED: uncharacterized protein LOC101298028 [Fragaria vesca subsp. vesca]
MNSAATGYIIIDDNGQFVVAGAKRVGSSSVPTVEVAALREGLLKARDKHIKIMVEEDSKLVIDCIKGTCATPGRLKKMVQDIKQICKYFESCCFQHVFREANFSADALANLDHTSNMHIDLEGSCPLQIGNALLFDRLGLRPSGCTRDSIL